jgi:hypothetical protein
VPLPKHLGTLTSWNPLGHSRPVTGLLYLFYLIIIAASLVVCGQMTQSSITRNVSVTYLFCQVPTAKLDQLAFDFTCQDRCTGVSAAQYWLRAGSFMSDAEAVIKYDGL